MKIAHINEIAGVAGILSRAQRRLGHEAVLYVLRDSPYNFPADVRLRGADGPLGWNGVMMAHWKEFSRYDVLHVHGGMWRSQVFFPAFARRFRWKPVAVHYHGGETRTGRGLHYADFAKVQFHSTPDLAKWLPRSTWIPNPIELSPLPPVPDHAVPRFGHFVSSPQNKGTERVIQLFRDTFGPTEREPQDHLEIHRARDAELWIAYQKPHVEALEIMKACDAVIDQIATFGIYGMVAIEGMAFGKPVLGTPNQEWYPGCPIIPLGGRTDIDTLRAVATDPALRRARGQAGRAYVEKVHDAGKVARLVLKAYYDAIQQPALDATGAASYWRHRGVAYASEFTSREVVGTQTAQVDELVSILKGLEFDSIAEVGCGYGRVGARLMEAFGARWTGADLSRAQLVEALRRHPEMMGRVVEVSASALPFANASADLALATEVLMHIPPDRIKCVMQEMWRVARRHVVHIDWFEDYLLGHQTGWCWVHDYPALWRSLGGHVREVRLRSTRIQSAFVVSKTPPALA